VQHIEQAPQKQLQCRQALLTVDNGTCIDVTGGCGNQVANNSAEEVRGN
jgi:hypothetical protein